MRLLRMKGALGNTTVVAALPTASLGHKVATLASALALGERMRDVGGHAIVVLDDITAMVRGKPCSTFLRVLSIITIVNTSLLPLMSG